MEQVGVKVEGEDVMALDSNPEDDLKLGAEGQICRYSISYEE